MGVTWCQAPFLTLSPCITGKRMGFNFLKTPLRTYVLCIIMGLSVIIRSGPADIQAAMRFIIDKNL